MSPDQQWPPQERRAGPGASPARTAADRPARPPDPAAEAVRRSPVEETLSQRERQLAEAQRLAALGIWEWDIPSDRVTWSEELYRIYGVTPETFGASYEGFLDCVHPEDREQTHAIIQHSFATGEPFDFEHRIVCPDGSVRTLHARGRVVMDAQGRAVRMYGTGQDVTERRELEEQLRAAQKMEAVGRLAGGIAHQFNNLLTVVLGHSELILAHRGLPPGVLQSAKEILTAATRGGELTQQILAFSCRQLRRVEVLDLNAVVAQVKRLLRTVLPEDIELVVVPGTALHPVLADRRQMEQVLMNLAVNAGDAMPRGGTFTICTGNRFVDESEARSLADLSPGHYVLLEVSDTGSGMDEETLLHLFEPFFSTKEMGDGTGLGLSTVYGIIKQSGGHISVTSQPGRGSTFRIFLPQHRNGSRAGAPVGSH
jgi:PAS domain S-box-containing protein